jgi:hypothetical protein
MSYRTGSGPCGPLQTFFLANDRHSSRRQIWWSRTGSNRRPPACKAGALPAELRPLIPVERMVGLGGLEPPTSRLSSARSNQLSYKPCNHTQLAASGTGRAVRARAKWAWVGHSRRKRNEGGRSRFGMRDGKSDSLIVLFQVNQKAEAQRVSVSIEVHP